MLEKNAERDGWMDTTAINIGKFFVLFFIVVLIMFHLGSGLVRYSSVSIMYISFVCYKGF